MISPRKMLMLVMCWFGLLASPVWGQAAPRVDLDGEPLPPGTLARLGTLRWRYEAGFTAFAFAPNGKVLACALGDHTIRLLDVDSGKELRVLRGHTNRIAALTYCAYGKVLGSTSEDATLSRWQVETGQLLSVIKIPSPDYGQALSPDGRIHAIRLAADTIHLLDAASGKLLRRWKAAGNVGAPLAFSPDGKTLATVNLNEITFWKVASGELLGRIDWKEGKKGAWISHALTFSGDGRLLAVVRQHELWMSSRSQYYPHKVWWPRLFNVATGQEVVQLQQTYRRPLLPEQNSTHELKFGNDGTLYAFGQINRRWDVATGKTMPMVPAPIYSNALSSDGKMLVGSRSRSPVIELWDTTTGKRRNLLPGHWTIPHALAFSQDGKTLVSAADDLRVWDTGTREQIQYLEKRIENLFSCADGRIIYTTTHRDSPRTLDLATNQGIVPAVQDAWDTLTLSADGKRMATGHSGNDDLNQPGVVRIWDLRSGKGLRHWIAHPVSGTPPMQNPRFIIIRTLPVVVHALSTDGKLVVTSDGERPFLRLWETATGWPLLKLPVQQQPSFVTFASESNWIATGTKETLSVWNTQTGSRLELPDCHANACFSKDGQLIFTGGKDGKIRLWETATGKVAHSFQAHGSPVYALALSADGKTLASAGGDTAILLWDLSAFWNVPPRLASAKDLESWWASLKADEATLAYQAMSQLTAQPNAVAFLKKHLDFGPNKAVEHIAQLLVQVGDTKFAVREKAQQELKALGNTAHPFLKQTLQQNLPLETTRRLQKLLAALPEWPAHVLSGETLRTVRAVQVLERIGTAPAQALLTALRQGTPLAPETQEARAALERLTQIPPQK